MIKKLLFLGVLIAVIMIEVSAANPFSCRVSTGNSCFANESQVFSVNSGAFDLTKGFLINGYISSTFNTNYNNPICCSVNIAGVSKVKFNSTVPANSPCPVNSKELLYLTNSTSGKLAHNSSPLFNLGDYSNKLCVEKPIESASLDIFVSNKTSFGNIGYECLFRMDSLVNSVVSSCNATYGANQQYPNIVWAKLWEKTSSITCNLDCTSKLDNRVYSVCGSQINNCRGIPSVCNGALLGSTVNFNSTHEVTCGSPWATFKLKTFGVKTLTVTSSKQSCSNLLNKKFSVILNNQLVTMNVYNCGGGVNN